MPIGILVKPIEMAGDTFVYLLEVQESSSKPHQLSPSKQYPVRLDGQSIGAPHYLVEALFKQVRRPELKGFLRIISYRIFTNPGDPYNTIALRFEVTIFCISKTINDTDVYIQLLTRKGRFAISNDISRKNDLNSTRVTVLKATSLISDGLPTRHVFDFQVTTTEMNELEGNPLKIRLGFGGTNSVTKFSFYYIGFRPNVNLTPSEWGIVFTKSKDLNNLIEVQKEENVSVSDRWQGNDEERIELTLGGI